VKKVAVFGYYGQGNFGDDLFCFMLESAAKNIPSLELRFIGRQKYEKSVGLAKYSAALVRSRTKAGRFWRIGMNILAVLQADAILYGGGSVFGKYASLPQRRLVVRLARLFGRPLYATGVSVGPFIDKRQQSEFCSLLANFCSIQVRDQYSLSLLQLNGLVSVVSETGDMVFGLPECLPVLHSQENKYIIVAIHREEYTRYLPLLKEALPDIRCIVIVELDEESRRCTPTLLSKELPGVEFRVVKYNEGNLEKIVQLIAGAQFVLTSKLHGAIAAFAYSVPAVLFPYQEKCKEFVKTTKLVGLDSDMPEQGVFIDTVQRAYSTPIRKVERYSTVAAFTNLVKFLRKISER